MRGRLVSLIITATLLAVGLGAGLYGTQPAGATTAAPAEVTATPTPCAIRFSDVQTSDYFYTPVLYLACHGAISGYADGTFRPYANMTRGQMVKVVVLGFQLPAHVPPAGQQTFADVPPAQPFYAYIETASQAGLVSGYACNQAPAEPCDAQQRPYFRPNANVTRGQLAKIIVTAAGWAPQSPPVASFADVPPGSPFYLYIEVAACHAVVSGYADGTYRPGTNATRGQIAKIAYGAITNPSGACVFPSPVPTLTPAPPTATPPATITPTPPPTPTFPSCGHFILGASVSNPTPPQYSDETAYGTFMACGAGVAGLPMHTVWHYRTTTSTCDGLTDATGTASCTRNISRATLGYTVLIDVQLTYNGRVYTTQTSFTPQ